MMCWSQLKRLFKVNDWSRLLSGSCCCFVCFLASIFFSVQAAHNWSTKCCVFVSVCLHWGRGGLQREREREDATETTRWKGEKMSDGRKHSKTECRVCKVKISYGAGFTNNLHRHIRTVHPSVQWEEKKVPVCLLQLSCLQCLQ